MTRTLLRMICLCIVGRMLFGEVAWANADSRARKELQSVAKRWCETIRASQVIPVYPLTEDLVPGDVFLVQMPIADQASLYKRKGFLTLDDHRTRLSNLDFKRMYSDGYWKDEFGSTPHPRPGRPSAGPMPENTPIALTEALAPRAAFPAYSFSAKASQGLGLAVPIKSVPVGLSFLRTSTASGSVLIADTRTYAADGAELYQKLRAWASLPEVRPSLVELTRNRNGRQVFLRVVTRVYLTGGVVVSLHRSTTSGGGVTAGDAPNVSLVTPDGTLNKNYDQILEQLNKAAEPAKSISAAAGAGVAFKFLGASESDVSMAEAFDRLLAVGYLGFDVELFEGGELGVPVPTFDHLEQRVTTSRPTVAGPLTDEQQRLRFDLVALKALAENEPDRVRHVIARATAELPEHDFDCVRTLLANKPCPDSTDPPTVEKILKAFTDGATTYAAQSGANGVNYQRLSNAVAHAWDF
ncbi:MAG TPA: hypothetical protein VFV19_18835 [Candidatus Polarisedimenticolaceae bacterium]|nr:hypothetical protein [Candidatus Polarisedimenticolaceae bacterium]